MASTGSRQDIWDGKLASVLVPAQLTVKWAGYAWQVLVGEARLSGEQAVRGWRCERHSVQPL